MNCEKFGATRDSLMWGREGVGLDLSLTHIQIDRKSLARNDFGDHGPIKVVLDRMRVYLSLFVNLHKIFLTI